MHTASFSDPDELTRLHQVCQQAKGLDPVQGQAFA